MASLLSQISLNNPGPKRGKVCFAWCPVLLTSHHQYNHIFALYINLQMYVVQVLCMYMCMMCIYLTVSTSKTLPDALSVGWRLLWFYKQGFCFLSGYRQEGFSQVKWVFLNLFGIGGRRCAVASGSLQVRLSGYVQLTPRERLGRESSIGGWGGVGCVCLCPVYFHEIG